MQERGRPRARYNAAMRYPDSLEGLVDVGIIDEVIRPLMSGKEAQVYLVSAGGELRVAKVYKQAQNRSFRQRAMYAEGRRVKNSRRQRAIDKRSKYGREEEEQAWKSAEVDAIHILADAGVRVPRPYDFVDGVLVMELIADEYGEPAPRLVDVRLTAEEAHQVLHDVVREVCRMLCAGLVHGDLSDFNILVTPTGLVIIDFPQAVDAAANNNAKKLLIRDLNNVQEYLSRWAPELRKLRYGEEMWDLYDRGKLEPESPLTGKFKRKTGKANTAAILQEIQDSEHEERARRARLGLDPLPQPRSRYAEKKRQAREELSQAAAQLLAKAKEAPAPRSRRRNRGRSRDGATASRDQPGRAAQPNSADARRDPSKRTSAKAKRNPPEPRRNSRESRQTSSPKTLADDLDAFLIFED